MQPSQEDQSLHLVTKLYQKQTKLLKEMLGIQYVIQHEWLTSHFQEFITWMLGRFLPGVGDSFVDWCSKETESLNSKTIAQSVWWKDIYKCRHWQWNRQEGNDQELIQLPNTFRPKKVREKSREWHNHKPQPFPDPKRKRKPTNLNKRKLNKRTKSTKISSLFPKRGNRNTKRTEKHKNKMTHGKTYNKSPHRINHKATKSKTNTGTTALERSVEQITRHQRERRTNLKERHLNQNSTSWKPKKQFISQTLAKRLSKVNISPWHTCKYVHDRNSKSQQKHRLGTVSNFLLMGA